ncbi:MAG TPA: pyridoxamine 5'-phosphate oxidase family protein [Candidatus Dormibacteraeota bacterium]|nr:pyridoxamine 5'-phosphate oxidase family protein [Candidatus Dormibacteraeota bacterium]
MTTNDDLATWADLETAAPALAATGKGVLAGGGEAGALLATIRGDAPPRIHPVTVSIVAGGLYVFLLDSAKRRDLAEDGRYALHGHQDPALPSEFSVRGRARLVPAGAVRDRVASGWAFEVDDSYWLFELRIESAILGERAADEWPPRYTRWSVTQR